MIHGGELGVRLDSDHPWEQHYLYTEHLDTEPCCLARVLLTSQPPMILKH